MVITWKHREEQGGWFRRVRLIARQYKWSVFTDDAFVPTSAYALVRLMIHLAINQSSDENGYVTRGGKVFKLGRVLPGQRTAASQWFKEFNIQPSYRHLHEMMKQPPPGFGIVHVEGLSICRDGVPGAGTGGSFFF